MPPSWRDNWHAWTTQQRPVNDNWRMVFAFEGVHAVLVDYLDYH